MSSGAASDGGVVHFNSLFHFHSAFILILFSFHPHLILSSFHFHSLWPSISFIKLIQHTLFGLIFFGRSCDSL
ncbi:hypothetical protein FB451DRAFT_389180 [Mycena latifolia]|nr:hypothetical protein FB451DRAFT_389180 [Mycena latifolia]